ncbi:MAG: glutathione S-transferase [Proteobacteria bacterium]|nr:glutathione S-transferase [Pseudomonadota bacterium]NOG60362.1 glutathione S-transferase [Pseudomonadota bacterium]
MIKLYRYPLSGNAHRVELFLSLLGLEYSLVDVDLLNGEQKSESFLKLNPFGQVPVLDDDGFIIYESSASLVYLAKKYDDGHWLPEDAQHASMIQQWLSIATSRIAAGPATARLITLFGANHDANEVIQRSNNLLQVINNHLENRIFLVGDGPTIADVAAYTYIAHAPEGNISLTPYTNIVEWLKRIESLKGFIGMQKSKVGLAA